jgi:hypothetical protein
VAREVSFFSSNIDYWATAGVPQQAPTPEKGEIPEKTIEKKGRSAEQDSQAKTFEWKNYLDANSTDFFREGDYTPPEPYMELVRNPTDRNISMWFAYMGKKNALAERLSKRMEEYAMTHGTAMPREATEAVMEKARSLPVASDDFERYRFRMYFDSTCPHCKHMFETLNELQDRGYFVEARQLDSGSTEHLNSHVAITAAAPGEAKRLNISSVPFLLVGDLKSKKVFKQSGYASAVDVLAKVHEKDQ